MPAFNVTTIYGMKSREPIVKIRYQDFEVQVSPHEARELALNLLGASEAAEHDAFIFEFWQDNMGLPLEKVAALVGEFRLWREAHYAKKQKT